MKLKTIASALFLLHLLGCSAPDYTPEPKKELGDKQKFLVKKARKQIELQEEIKSIQSFPGTSAIVTVAHNYFYGKNGFEQDYAKAYEYLMHHFYRADMHELPSTTDVMNAELVSVKIYPRLANESARWVDRYNGHNYFLLAQMYEQGLGQRVDLEKAFKYYLLAAHQPINAKIWNSHKLQHSKIRSEEKVKELYSTLYGRTQDASALEVTLKARSFNYGSIDDVKESALKYHDKYFDTSKTRYIEMLVSAPKQRPIILTGVEVATCQKETYSNIFNEQANHYVMLGDRLFLEKQGCFGDFHSMKNEVILNTLNGKIHLKPREFKTEWWGGVKQYHYYPVDNTAQVGTGVWKYPE